MYDARDLMMVASGNDIAPACQVSSRCFTAVGTDFLSSISIEEAREFLTARGSLLKREVREKQASFFADKLFSHSNASMMELYGGNHEHSEENQKDEEAVPKESPQIPDKSKSMFRNGSLSEAPPIDGLSTPLPTSLRKAARAEMAF